MISIIAAVARNRVIGGNNSMPWHIGEDLKRFKAITSGHPVIMGRKTFESLGKALPNRRNVVVTRNTSFKATGVETAASLSDALGMFSPEEEVFVIGGGDIYRQAMPDADRMYLTYICADYDGDTTFPEFDSQKWRIVSSERHEHGEKFPYPFEFIDYERIR